MRWLVVFVGIGGMGCAGTQRVCPTESRLMSESSTSGRVEWCRRDDAPQGTLPVPGRVFEDRLGTVAHPPPRSGGMHGPFTHWFPNGAVESHGAYVEEAAASVPDGVWGFWYDDGKRRQLGRYELGKPVGCFAAWDRDGQRITGIVHGTTVHEQPCEPPSDATLVQIEARTQGLASRGKGDVTLRAAGHAGAFGLTNATQIQPTPGAVAATELVLRRRLGRFRVGPALGVRLSDGDAHAYTGGAVVGVGARVGRRIDTELEVGVGAQYIDLLARRPDVLGATHVTFWAPTLSARLGGALSLGSDLQLVAGVRVDGSPEREVTEAVRYNPFMNPVLETWTVGGVGVGVDLGLRLVVR